MMAARVDAKPVDATPVDAASVDEERNEAGETLLIVAAEQGDEARVRELLDAGADPTMASLSNWTALHGAAECGSVGIIAALAAAGADVSAQANSGKTPLDIARQYERPEAASKLAELGGAANVSC